MPLTVQTPSGFVSLIQNAIIGYTTKIKNFSSGSAIGALVNAISTQLLFLQSQAQYVFSVTRAATSTGADLTSFATDYGMNPPRILATQATTSLVFGKYQTPSVAQVIPVGTLVQTPTALPGTPVQFVVIADSTNVNYNPALANGVGGYALGPGTSTVSVTAQCTVAGVVGNVIAGQLSVIVTPNVPADYVSNPSAVQNGFAQETDAALLVRFGFYISSLATANMNAIATAILSVATNLTYTINDRLNASGAATPAYFTVVVDDGSGNIPTNTLALVSAAINLIRAAGISFTVIAPTIKPIAIVVSGTVVSSSFNAANVRAAIQAALIAYVDANGVGGANLSNGFVPAGSISYIGIAGVVASFIGNLPNQGLVSYSSITVNGATANVAVTNYQITRTTPSTCTVS